MTKERWLKLYPGLFDGVYEGCQNNLLSIVEQIYISGVLEGVKQYAWWKNGTQYVGTCGTTLKAACERIIKEVPKPTYYEVKNG